MTRAPEARLPAHSLPRQVVTFGIVGGLSTLAHVIVALQLNAIVGLSPLWANVSGYLSAVTVSYVGNALLTFRGRLLHGGQAVRFVTVSLAGLGLGQAITYVVTSLLHAPFAWALVLVVTIVPAFSFLAFRIWAFAVSKGEGPHAG